MELAVARALPVQASNDTFQVLPVYVTILTTTTESPTTVSLAITPVPLAPHPPPAPPVTKANTGI